MESMDPLQGLNREQRAAVEHVDGPLLVVAGAGTGKTQVITRRIAHLIAKGHAKPTEILALTFTEKAAREMQERLFELIGWESYSVSVLTFNAFGSDFLVRFASHIGRSIVGGLLNDVQKTLLLQQHLDRISLSYYGSQGDIYEFLEGITRYIGELQNAGVSVEDYRKYVAEVTTKNELHPRDIAEQQDLLALYELYETLKIERGAIDYNDQLQLPLEILKSRPNIVQRLTREYKFVLVDEYQDTNPVQDAILRMIVPPTGNIFAVGDDDQAIYGFRGAEIGNILNFTEHYAVKQPIVLTQNYRSGQAILDTAYDLIQHNNPERLEAKLGLDKHLIAQHRKATAEYVPYVTGNDERQAVAHTIASRIEAGELGSGIAVLSATHAPLKSLAKILKSQKVPFALSTSTNIFEQPELLHLWYLLRWIGHSASDEAIGHVILSSFVGREASDYRRLLETSRTDLLNIETALRSSTEEQDMALVGQLDEWRKWAEVDSVGRLAFRLIFESEVGNKWQAAASDSPRMQRVFEDLSRLFEQMQDFETVAVDPKLAAYMGFFPVPPTIEVSEPVGESEGVQLLTVHASKGLEFETVYLIGCTQRAWSSGVRAGLEVPEVIRRSTELPPEHEYRRLMYVAATRAKRELVVSAGTQTNGGTRQQVSGFIREMFGDEAAKVPQAVSEVNAIDKTLKKIQQYYPLKDAYTQHTLPFESSDGWIELAVGDIVSYERCPYDFYLEKVLGLRQPFGPQMAFGVALHAAFQGYYEAKLRGEAPDANELALRLDEAWSDNGYLSKIIADQEHELARKTLAAFIAREDAAERVVKGVELPIRLEIPEAKLRLKGRIDALFMVEGGIELRDYKTGRTKTDPEKLSAESKESKQLRSYALAFEIMSGEAPARVTLDYVVTGAEGEAELSSRILKNHREYLAKVAEKIRNREFAPKASAFHTCAAIKYYGTGEAEEAAE